MRVARPEGRRHPFPRPAGRVGFRQLYPCLSTLTRSRTACRVVRERHRVRTLTQRIRKSSANLGGIFAFFYGIGVPVPFPEGQPWKARCAAIRDTPRVA